MPLEKINEKRELLDNLHILYEALNSDNQCDVKIAKELIQAGNQYIAVEDIYKNILFAPIKFLRYKNYETVTEYKELSKRKNGNDAKDINDKVVTGTGAFEWFKSRFSFLENSDNDGLSEKFSEFCGNYGIDPKKNDGRDFLSFIDNAFFNENDRAKGGSVMNNISEYTDVLKIKKNIILQGAPGTGKTYSTAAIALSIIDADIAKTLNLSDHAAVMQRYEEYRSKEQIFFCTFHQSMDYEDFVEGLRPEISGNGTAVTYKVKPGIFKNICTKASSDTSRNFVLIIDEINRGNVSKIFGELITLLEKDKRTDGDHPISVILPYSNESFSVPSNLYIIGTMNTTDRSTGTIDYAVRRRFDFITLEADENALDNMSETKDKAKALFRNVRAFIEDKKIADMDISDLMVGHSYFMAENENELKLKIKYEVIPLVKEYIKDGILNCLPDEANKFFNAWKELNTRDIGTGDEPVIESKE